MHSRSILSLVCASGLAASLGLLPARPAACEEKPAFEVHQWSVWLSRAGADKVNSPEDYPGSVPWLPVTSRPRSLPSGQPGPSPLNLLTFYGKPAARVDVDLQVQKGSILGGWPAASKSDTRLRWLGYSLSSGSEGKPAGALESPVNWFTPARAEDALALRTYGGRGEQFLSYDFEATFPLPFKLEGGPEKYEAQNTGGYPLYDVVLAVPTEKGTRIGWLDLLRPSAKGTPVDLSLPLAAGSDELAALASRALSRRLEKAGLNRHEVEFLVSHYKSAIFEAPTPRVAFRLSPIVVSHLMPLVVEPEPAKTVRVTLVIADEIEPLEGSDAMTLVKQLGSPKYAEREAAEKMLLGMRARAVPALRQAMNSSDPEVAYRAERVLSQLQPAVNDPRARQIRQ